MSNQWATLSYLNTGVNHQVGAIMCVCYTYRDSFYIPLHFSKIKIWNLFNFTALVFKIKDFDHGVWFFERVRKKKAHLGCRYMYIYI